MSDQERYAGRFSAEVDRILEQQGRAEAEGPPPEYAEMLAIAERLARLDFGGDSPLRPQLRRRLLNQQEANISAHRRRWRPLFPLRPRRALGALLALVTLVVLVGWTPVGRAVTDAVRELIWPHTTVEQVSPGNESGIAERDREWFEAQLAAGKAWEFSFEGRTFIGCCSGEEQARNEVVTWSRAVAEAGFDLQLPAVLPDGYILSQVRLLGAAPYDVFTIYEGGDGRLGLYQSSVGIISEKNPSENVSVVERREIGVVTDGTITKVVVGGVQAALINEESLVWEENKVSFRLIGPGLGVETLVRIADSLAPAQ